MTAWFFVMLFAMTFMGCCFIYNSIRAGLYFFRPFEDIEDAIGLAIVAMSIWGWYIVFPLFKITWVG